MTVGLNRLSSHSEILIRKLEANCTLSDREKSAIAALPIELHELGAGHDIVRIGDRPSQCCLLLDGFAYRYKFVGQGLRQILSFHIPGDMPDLLSLHLPVMDHSLGTIGASNVGLVSHDSINRLIAAYPRIGAALWRETLIDGSMFREWLAAVGRRNAHARIAHLLCEIVTRMEVVGLALEKCVQTPITQSAIADALGLTAVHVNRVAKDLRAEGLITWRGRSLKINDWDRLAAIGEFDPAYLHLRSG